MFIKRGGNRGLCLEGKGGHAEGGNKLGTIVGV